MKINLIKVWVIQTILCLTTATVALGSGTNQLPLPNSITALAAINRARIAIRVARRNYERAVEAARRVEKQKLQIALAHTMRRGNLKDAVLIKRWINGSQSPISGTYRSARTLFLATYKIHGRPRVVNITHHVLKFWHNNTLHFPLRVSSFLCVFPNGTDPAPGVLKEVTITGRGFSLSLPDTNIPGVKLKIYSPTHR